METTVNREAAQPKVCIQLSREHKGSPSRRRPIGRKALSKLTETRPMRDMWLSPGPLSVFREVRLHRKRIFKDMAVLGRICRHWVAL